MADCSLAARCRSTSNSRLRPTCRNSENGGRDFVAYAYAMGSGQETSVSVPVFIGAAPTANADRVFVRRDDGAGQQRVVELCRRPSESGAAASAPAVAGATAAAAVTAPMMSTSAVPFLQLANPSAGDVLPTGDIIITGSAYDPAAMSGAGIDRVELFLDPRENGGLFIGSVDADRQGVQDRRGSAKLGQWRPPADRVRALVGDGSRGRATGADVRRRTACADASTNQLSSTEFLASAQAGCANGTAGSGCGVLNARCTVGSVPAFQFLWGTPWGKTPACQVAPGAAGHRPRCSWCLRGCRRSDPPRGCAVRRVSHCQQAS